MSRPAPPREANPHIEAMIRSQLLPREIKREIDTQKISLESLSKNIESIQSLEDPTAQFLLKLVTDELKAKGLWRDEDKDLTMTEAFPIDQTKVDARLTSEDQMALEHGTFLTDANLTHEDLSAPANTIAIPIGPIHSEPMLHNLMRASPRDLYQQLARRLIDANFFVNGGEHPDLYRACYFASRGVEDEHHFNVLMLAGLADRFPSYCFLEYWQERKELRKLFKKLKASFFTQNPAIKNRLKLNSDPERKSPHAVWERFDRVWTELTDKQQEILELCYMSQDNLSIKSAAAELGISVDSVKSRITSAFSKFEIEFPEFVGMTPKSLPREKLRGAVTHNGLWRYETAAMKAPLFKIDPKNGLRLSEARHTTLPRSKNLGFKTVARIKAQIIESCPVPRFHETEYFDGMKPTILTSAERD